MAARFSFFSLSSSFTFHFIHVSTWWFGISSIYAAMRNVKCRKVLNSVCEEMCAKRKWNSVARRQQPNNWNSQFIVGLLCVSIPFFMRVRCARVCTVHVWTNERNIPFLVVIVIRLYHLFEIFHSAAISIWSKSCEAIQYSRSSSGSSRDGRERKIRENWASHWRFSIQ